MAVPPWATSRSAATPSAGLAVTPELPSDPPHSMARQILEAGCSVRTHELASGMQLIDGPRGRLDRAGDPALLLDIEGPRPMSAASCARCRWPSQRDEVLRLDQVLSEADLAAEPHDHVGRHVGMMGETREHALEDLVVGPFERQPATPFVGDGEDAVDIGEIPPPGAVAESVGDIPGRAGRAIHRADHGDVVPRADPSVGPEKAPKRPRPVRPGVSRAVPMAKA